MKLSIISPRFPHSGRVPVVPPILEYLAALTAREAPGTDITLIDANQQHISPEKIDADLVAISVMTATAPWAYRFADACRRLGIPVVLGGIHASALPDEAAEHADSVVIGEAESVWEDVLRDMRQGSMKKFYRGERLPLVNLPQPVDGKLKGNYRFRAFFTMRGCPYRCTFCSVRKFYGDTIRYRPIDQVVAEVEACAGKIWFNGDDNIWGGDLRRSTELFNELAKGSKRHWYGFGDLRSVQTPEGDRMLAAARKSGLFSVWVGWENEESRLATFNAVGKQGADRVAAVKKMQDSGIDVTLFVVLGGRQDSADSFKRILDLSEKMNVGIHPVLLTPLPGTELYEEYKHFLLPELSWEAFTGVRAVFDHPSPEMHPLRREYEYHNLCRELFCFKRIMQRTLSLPAADFPTSHMMSVMTQLPMKLAFSKAYTEWETELEENPASPDVTVAASTGTPDLSSVTPDAHSAVQRISWYAYAAFLCLTTVMHLLEVKYHYLVHPIDYLEDVFYWGVIASSIAYLCFRGVYQVESYKALGRRYRHRLERWKLAVREAAYSAALGAGGYWAYLCQLT